MIYWNKKLLLRVNERWLEEVDAGVRALNEINKEKGRPKMSRMGFIRSAALMYSNLIRRSRGEPEYTPEDIVEDHTDV